MLHIFMNRANLQDSPCARGAQSFFFGVKIETLTWANITLNSFLAWSVIKKICYNLIQIQLLQHPSNNNWYAYCQQSLVLYFRGFEKWVDSERLIMLHAVNVASIGNLN